jgi:hypothetical protein
VNEEVFVFIKRFLGPYWVKNMNTHQVVSEASTFNVTSLFSPKEGIKFKQKMFDEIWSLEQLHYFFV